MLKNALRTEQIPGTIYRRPTLRPGGICNQIFQALGASARFVILCNNRDICQKHRAASPDRTTMSEPEPAMSFVSAAAVRTAVFVIALSGAGLWALRAMDAKADPPAFRRQLALRGRARSLRGQARLSRSSRLPRTEPGRKPGGLSRGDARLGWGARPRLRRGTLHLFCRLTPANGCNGWRSMRPPCKRCLARWRKPMWRSPPA